MPDDMGDSPGGKGPKEPKDEKRREQIIAGAAVAGVLLTVILIRKSGGQPSGAMPVSPPIAASTGGGGGSTSDPRFDAVETQIHGIQSDMTLLAAHLGNGMSSSQTGVSSSPVNSSASAPRFSTQTVDDLFARYGFTSVPATATETSQQREQRILRDLNSGARTPDQVAASIAILPH